MVVELKCYRTLSAILVEWYFVLEHCEHKTVSEYVEIFAASAVIFLEHCATLHNQNQNTQNPPLNSVGPRYCV